MYTFINVMGLAIGITCVMLAVIFAKDEASFDSFHEKKNELYRIVTTLNDENGDRKTVAGQGNPRDLPLKKPCRK